MGNIYKKVIITVEVEILDELALRDAGFISVRQTGGQLVDTDEDFQSSTDLALQRAFTVEPWELPGARVIGLITEVHDQ